MIPSRSSAAVSCSSRRCRRTRCRSDAAALHTRPRRGRPPRTKRGGTGRQARHHLAQRQASREADRRGVLAPLQSVSRRSPPCAASNPPIPLSGSSMPSASLEGSRSDVMLVGHFPFMPQLLGHLVGGRPDAAPIPFPMNGMVALEHLAGNWVERWRLDG